MPRTATGTLLELDLALAAAMGESPPGSALPVIEVDVLRIDRGRWDPPAVEAGALGLLVLSGLFARRVALGPAMSSELLGPGDVLRPWDDLAGHLRHESGFDVLDSARVAVLDPRATSVIGRWPKLQAAVTERVLRRARCLAFLMAASNFVRVEDRVLATLWHLGKLWGEPAPEGIVVPFLLTHETLSEVVGAHRSSVTTALAWSSSAWAASSRVLLASAWSTSLDLPSASAWRAVLIAPARLAGTVSALPAGLAGASGSRPLSQR